MALSIRIPIALSMAMASSLAVAQPVSDSAVPPPRKIVWVENVVSMATASQHEMMLDDMRRHIGMNGSDEDAVAFEQMIDAERMAGRYPRTDRIPARLYRTGLPEVLGDHSHASRFGAGPA